MQHVKGRAPVRPRRRRAAQGDQRPGRGADVVAEQAAAERREYERQARHQPVDVGLAATAVASATRCLWCGPVASILISKLRVSCTQRRLSMVCHWRGIAEAGLPGEA